VAVDSPNVDDELVTHQISQAADSSGGYAAAQAVDRSWPDPGVRERQLPRRPTRTTGFKQGNRKREGQQSTEAEVAADQTRHQRGECRKRQLCLLAEAPVPAQQ